MPRVSQLRPRRLLGATVLAAAAAFAVPHAALAASSSTTFSDPAGDATAATDLTQVTLTSNRETITARFQVRDVDAPFPFGAFAPAYRLDFVGPANSFGQPTTGVLSTRIGNADRTALYAERGGGSLIADGTRTIDPVANTVTLSFKRADIKDQGAPHLLDPGTVLSSLTAETDFQQQLLFGAPDNAAAPAGTTHTIGG